MKEQFLFCDASSDNLRKSSLQRSILVQIGKIMSTFNDKRIFYSVSNNYYSINYL